MRRGFSLVELSIVLVILGLLTGGILAGKSLIRASELRAITRQYTSYAAAIHSFRDKYFALPGDITNAQSIWGAGTCNGTSTTGIATCNGNGDALIGVGASQEQWHFWRHLANAGLIEGTYTGAAGPAQAAWDAVIGTNVPSSKISGVGWMVMSLVYATGNSEEPALVSGLGADSYVLNHMVLGRESGAYWTSAGFLKPEEAWNIDSKIDDGKPGTGILLSTWANSCTNTANGQYANIIASSYSLTVTTEACALIFMPKSMGL